MIRPVSVISHTRRDTRQLWFPDGSQGEFYVRGALCWPIATGPQSISGFALLAGVHCDTGVCHVFEQTGFATVAPVIDQDSGAMQEAGLGSWFVKMWGLYHAERYYWSQSESVHRAHLLQTLRLPALNPKPVFVAARWDDLDEALASLWSWINAGSLLIPEQTPLQPALQRFSVQPGADASKDPAMHALLTLLHALVLYPWRKKGIERDTFVA